MVGLKANTPSFKAWAANTVRGTSYRVQCPMRCFGAGMPRSATPELRAHGTQPGDWLQAAEALIRKLADRKWPALSRRRHRKEPPRVGTDSYPAGVTRRSAAPRTWVLRKRKKIQ